MNENNKTLKSTDAFTVIVHWVLVIALIFSLATGLRVSADSPDSILAKAVAGILLQGNVVQWHVWAAFALLLASVAYAVFMVRARLKSRVVLDKTRLQALSNQDRNLRWKSINIVLYWVAFILILVVAITGVMLYFFPGVLPHVTVSKIHNIVAWSIIAYVVFHIVGQVAYGGFRHLLKIFNPRINYAGAALVGSVVAVAFGAGVYALDRLAINTLQVELVSTAPKLDGLADDAAWKRANSVDIPTNHGVNNAGGEVTVTVKMVRDDTHLYTLFEWPDPTRSQKHLPLQKTAQGWKVMQYEYHIQDEDDYYEDKFAVMFSRTPAIAGAGTSHYGSKPLENKPGPMGGRGLHYTTDNSIVDVWHWKSVRTGSPAMNQIDDNYFGPPMEVNPEKKRYTGGYTQDPSTGGGYTMNWEKFSPDTIKPLRLPKSPEVLARLGDVNLDPEIGDTGEYWMDMDMTVEYSEELDTYPVGTVMPSVLIKGPRQGDRGDVQAYSKWVDGRWFMEVSRKLKTDSKYDLNFSKEDPLYMWVAVFDHTQTRHSQHLHPVAVEMK